MDDSWKYRPRTGLADLLPLITASWLTRALFPRHRTYRCLQWWSKDSWRSFEVIAVTPFDTWYINDLWSQLGLGETGSRHGGRTVILELVRSKCVPILLYGLESCQLSITLICVRWTLLLIAYLWNCLRQRALMLLKLANLSLAQRSIVVF